MTALSSYHPRVTSPPPFITQIKNAPSPIIVGWRRSQEDLRMRSSNLSTACAAVLATYSNSSAASSSDEDDAVLGHATALTRILRVGFDSSGASLVSLSAASAELVSGGAGRHSRPPYRESSSASHRESSSSASHRESSFSASHRESSFSASPTGVRPEHHSSPLPWLIAAPDRSVTAARKVRSGGRLLTVRRSLDGSLQSPGRDASRGGGAGAATRRISADSLLPASSSGGAAAPAQQRRGALVGLWQLTRIAAASGHVPGDLPSPRALRVAAGPTLRQALPAIAPVHTAPSTSAGQSPPRARGGGGSALPPLFSPAWSNATLPRSSSSSPPRREARVPLWSNKGDGGWIARAQASVHHAAAVGAAWWGR